MTWRERILDDGLDRDRWLLSRSSAIGASDVKKYAKLESVPLYLVDKITETMFQGNEYTATGNKFESMVLAYLGVEPNSALIHAPGNPGFAATPDGLDSVLAEVKVRHGKIMPNPDVGEWRQLAWQLMCVPEADAVKFGTLTVLRDEHGEWEPRRKGAFSERVFTRDHPKIAAAAAQIIPIATAVLAALEGAQAAQKEAPF